MNDEQGLSKTFSRRAALLAGGQTLLLSALVGRMYYLQVVEADRYAMLAEDNRINLRLLPPLRGRIVDRFGVPLAANRQNYRAVLIAEETPDPARTLGLVAQLIPLSEQERADILREVARKRAFVPVTVRDHLTWAQVSAIELNALDLPGIVIEAGQTRHYPFGPPMAHVVGYVAPPSEREQTGDPLLALPGFRIGKNGVEKQFDSRLRGKAGSSQLEVNAAGRVIRELSRREGEPGEEITLTIDAVLQNYLHQRLMAERSASGVVLDVHTGEVLALASSPSFDPNAFNIGLSGKQWRALIEDPLTPLTDKALAGQYAPGSTFKMMVALAALEAGVRSDERAYCRGVVQLGNARFHCWKKEGHGWVDMWDGMRRSCDVYFYELARRLDIDKIGAMARRFGLGQPTGIDLPGERAGMVPTREWKRANFADPWQRGETLVTAIGQGFILATPLQLAVMTARIANGGYAVQPRVSRAATVAPGTPPAEDGGFPALGLNPAHLSLIHQAMDAVSNDPRGTAYRARIAEDGWEMAGKTGTSQVRRITAAERLTGVRKNEDLPWRMRDHALFVGFAPVTRPRYCCAVVVEHGGGGSKAAAPIVRDVLTEAQRRNPAGAAPVAAVPAGDGAEG